MHSTKYKLKLYKHEYYNTFFLDQKQSVDVGNDCSQISRKKCMLFLFKTFIKTYIKCCEV